MKLSQLAHFTAGGFASGAVEVSCDRCGTAEVFGLDHSDIGLSDLVAWTARHICPASVTAIPHAEAVTA